MVFVQAAKREKLSRSEAKERILPISADHAPILESDRVSEFRRLGRALTKKGHSRRQVKLPATCPILRASYLVEVIMEPRCLIRLASEQSRLSPK